MPTVSEMTKALQRRIDRLKRQIEQFRRQPAEYRRQPERMKRQIELIERENEQIERETRRIQRETERIERETYQTQLLHESRQQLASLIWGSFDSSLIKSMDFVVPPNLVVDHKIVTAAASMTRKLNEAKISEKNELSSVHNFLDNLISLVLLDGTVANRVVHKWRVRFPFQNSWQKLGMTILSSKEDHLSWFSYAGGLLPQNAAFSYHSDSSDSSDSSDHSDHSDHSDAKEAIKVSAMCVYARWEECGWEGTHIAFCGFANRHELGLARVKIDDETMALSAEVFGPIPLPGALKHSSKRAKKYPNDYAMRVLKHIFTSPPEDLCDIMSPPLIVPHAHEVEGFSRTCIPYSTTRMKTKTTVLKTSWSLGAFLGAGSFGISSMLPVSGTLTQTRIPLPSLRSLLSGRTRKG
jgi:hypothetical protein